MLDDYVPLTDAEVQAGARPGESWEEARLRMELDRQEGSAGESTYVGSFSLRASPRTYLFDMPPAQLEAHLAYQRLSKREQLEHWGADASTLDALEVIAALNNSKEPKT